MPSTRTRSELYDGIWLPEEMLLLLGEPESIAIDNRPSVAIVSLRYVTGT